MVRGTFRTGFSHADGGGDVADSACSRLVPKDLATVWLCHIYSLEYRELPAHWLADPSPTLPLDGLRGDYVISWPERQPLRSSYPDLLKGESTMRDGCRFCPLARDQGTTHSEYARVARKSHMVRKIQQFPV